MKTRISLGFLAVALVVLNSTTPPLATAQSPSRSPLRLLHAGERAIVLELTVDDFQIDTVQHQGQTYHRLLIPDTAQATAPGAPQVPTCGALVGLPSTEGVSIQILDVDDETLHGLHVLPAPRIEIAADNLEGLTAADVRHTFVQDQDLYATDAFYPGRPVEIGHVGYLRDQAVAQVQFYPVQYNPVTGEVRLYRRLLVRITWQAPPAETVETATDARWVNPAYENLLKNTLLNYTALKRPPATEAVRSVETSGPTIATTNSPPTLKIGVVKDGLYELTHDDLIQAGLDLSEVDPRTIKISHRGVEMPIYAHGQSDGTFDATDYLLFYGTATGGIYTVENIYWLTAGGTPGQRMSTRNGTPSGSATAPTHFPSTLHAEKDSHYWQTMPDGEGQDHWFWEGKLTAPASRAFTQTLNHISTTASTATVRLRLKGHTDVGANPDHHTLISLNGIEIDDQLWNGQIAFDHEVTVPHSYLDEGSNTITIEAPGDTAAMVDQVFVNWIEIDYWDTYVAENDELFFGAPEAGTFEFQIGGFSHNDITVFDVTDPTHVTIITNTAPLPDGVLFEDAAQPQTRYLALTPARHKTPARIELDQPSSWKSAANGADYVIITHQDFYTASLRLADHRSASGLTVATVKVEDIYDEFNDGIFDPQAIRDFLSFAYHNWIAPAPTYVLLVGDACQDYKDNLGTGTMTYVPSQVIEADLLGQTSSDNWFVQVSGDDLLPDMFIGRLTAQTASQAEDMVDKIIGYEQDPPSTTWNKNVLLVADDDGTSFEITSQTLSTMLPPYYTAAKVYVADYPPGDPTADIVAHINSGSVLVNYAGHGSVDAWGQWDNNSQDILDRNDIQTLDNTDKLPVVTAADCLNGYFTGIKPQVSVAEEFLQLPHRGAVAVWASTNLGYASEHRVLLRELYEAIFEDYQYALGAATTAAKIAAYSQTSDYSQLVETYVLFGDPATPLGIPSYPYVENTTPAAGGSDVAIDQTIHIAFNQPMSITTVGLDAQSATTLVLTPTWSADNTIVTYSHTNFDYSETLTLTVSGRDELGNLLGPGPVPTTWFFSVAPKPGDEDTYWTYLPLIIKND